MKHLRKYNESKEETEPLDGNYIRDCFIEFLDIPTSEIRCIRNFGYINLIEPVVEKEYKDSTFSIDEYIQCLSKHTEFYLDVKNCMEKVNIKYPNYIFNTHCKLGTLSIIIQDSRL